MRGERARSAGRWPDRSARIGKTGGQRRYAGKSRANWLGSVPPDLAEHACNATGYVTRGARPRMGSPKNESRDQKQHARPPCEHRPAGGSSCAHTNIKMPRLHSSTHAIASILCAPQKDKTRTTALQPHHGRGSTTSLVEESFSNQSIAASQ